VAEIIVIVVQKARFELYCGVLDQTGLSVQGVDRDVKSAPHVDFRSDSLALRVELCHVKPPDLEVFGVNRGVVAILVKILLSEVSADVDIDLLGHLVHVVGDCVVDE
jgi:hypothetical protein